MQVDVGKNSIEHEVKFHVATLFSHVARHVFKFVELRFPALRRTICNRRACQKRTGLAPPTAKVINSESWLECDCDLRETKSQERPSGVGIFCTSLIQHNVRVSIAVFPLCFSEKRQHGKSCRCFAKSVGLTNTGWTWTAQHPGKSAPVPSLLRLLLQKCLVTSTQLGRCIEKEMESRRASKNTRKNWRK